MLQTTVWFSRWRLRAPALVRPRRLSWGALRWARMQMVHQQSQVQVQVQVQGQESVVRAQSWSHAQAELPLVLRLVLRRGELLMLRLRLSLCALHRQQERQTARL